jgi:hypothetical protein
MWQYMFKSQFISVTKQVVTKGIIIVFYTLQILGEVIPAYHNHRITTKWNPIMKPLEILT